MQYIMGGDKKWDDTAERDLLLAIFLGNSATRPTVNWPKIHEIMTAYGYNFTKDAMSQHFTKILRDFKNRHGGVMPDSAPNTPRAGSATKRKTAKGKAGRKDANDDDDNGDMDQSPLKKIKEEKQSVAKASKDKMDTENINEWNSTPMRRFKKEKKPADENLQIKCDPEDGDEAYQRWLGLEG